MDTKSFAVTSHPYREGSMQNLKIFVVRSNNKSQKLHKNSEDFISKLHIWHGGMEIGSSWSLIYHVSTWQWILVKGLR